MLASTRILIKMLLTGIIWVKSEQPEFPIIMMLFSLFRSASNIGILYLKCLFHWFYYGKSQAAVK